MASENNHLNLVPSNLVPQVLRGSMNSWNQEGRISNFAHIVQGGPSGILGLGKRNRDAITNFVAVSNASQCPNLGLGDGIFNQVQNYHFDFDDIIFENAKRVKIELEAMQKDHIRAIVGTIREEAIKKLKEKEQQIERMNKVNIILKERLKSLFQENQMYKNLAQTNETMVNSLRSNLEQLLKRPNPPSMAESVCAGSNANVVQTRVCRMCKEKESCVLLLPCRHLCLCETCSNCSHQCPICNTHTSRMLHVNMN